MRIRATFANAQPPAASRAKDDKKWYFGVWIVCLLLLFYAHSTEPGDGARVTVSSRVFQTPCVITALDDEQVLFMDCDHKNLHAFAMPIDSSGKATPSAFTIPSDPQAHPLLVASDPDGDLNASVLRDDTGLTLVAWRSDRPDRPVLERLVASEVEAAFWRTAKAGGSAPGLIHQLFVLGSDPGRNKSTVNEFDYTESSDAPLQCPDPILYHFADSGSGSQFVWQDTPDKAEAALPQIEPSAQGSDIQIPFRTLVTTSQRVQSAPLDISVLTLDRSRKTAALQPVAQVDGPTAFYAWYTSVKKILFSAQTVEHALPAVSHRAFTVDVHRADFFRETNQKHFDLFTAPEGPPEHSQRLDDDALPFGADNFPSLTQVSSSSGDEAGQLKPDGQFAVIESAMQHAGPNLWLMRLSPAFADDLPLHELTYGKNIAGRPVAYQSQGRLHVAYVNRQEHAFSSGATYQVEVLSLNVEQTAQAEHGGIGALNLLQSSPQGGRFFRHQALWINIAAVFITLAVFILMLLKAREKQPRLFHLAAGSVAAPAAQTTADAATAAQTTAAQEEAAHIQ